MFSRGWVGMGRWFSKKRGEEKKKSRGIFMKKILKITLLFLGHHISFVHDR